MPDEPQPVRPILEYSNLPKPEVKLPIGMRGPNLLIAAGLGLLWYAVHQPEVVGLVVCILGGFMVLAGFKAHVLDVVKAYSIKSWMGQIVTRTKKPSKGNS